MFQNRVAQFLTTSPRPAMRSLVSCCSAFVAIPTPGGQSATGAIQHGLYQAALEAARRQVARRSVLDTWNWRNN